MGNKQMNHVIASFRLACVRFLQDAFDQQEKKLKSNKDMIEAFGKEVINSYIKLRSSEIKEFNRKEKFNKSKPVTKWESQNTLDC